MRQDGQLRAIIEADIYRYWGSGPRPFLYRCRVPSLTFTIALRKAQHHGNHGHNIRAIFWSVVVKFLSRRYLLQIPVGTQIGKGLFINHSGSIIVNPAAILGNNINLSPGVVIGQENRGARKGCPKIGNSVWIGANAVVVGNIEIGTNVLIAPGSFVNIDVPDNSIVIGNPASIRASTRATEGYVGNLV